MLGNEAVAEGALAAGLGFYAGYPITPSSEIAEILSERLPQRGGVFLQMEDEISSLAAVIGASVGGAKAATATSGPGFSLMQENIGFAVATEVPCVIISVMRAGPSTGQPTSPSQGDVMQARWGTHGDHPIIVLTASSVAECFRVTVTAFNLAERYRTPVILLLDEVVGHLRERVEMPPLEAVTVVERARPTMPPEWYFPYDENEGDVPALAPFGEGYRFHITGLFHDRAGFPTLRLDEIQPWVERVFRKINTHLEDILRWEEEGTGDAEIVLVSYGGSARAARHAMKVARGQGKAVGFLKLITLWPFPEAAVRRLAGEVKKMVVVEMNRGQMLLEVERVVAGRSQVVGVNRADGELVHPNDILKALEG
ncbi:MAG: 2-oxoacid:acceptor oxidoreductase subunit alpha [Chloroflexi bacterium]|nr:2-oxoacid:acceptor oxidoreductase subunit alpha [Chloroflexota bacterium]